MGNTLVDFKFVLFLIGKSEHIWDRFTHEGYAYNGDTGDIAGDSYHHLQEDVQLVKKLNASRTYLHI